MAGQSAKGRFLSGLVQANRVNRYDLNGLTAKQEAFAQLVSNGEKLSDAYRGAFATNGTATTVNRAASKLAKVPKVAARIEQLLKAIQASMLRDGIAIRRHVFNGLMAESRNPEAKPSERISALIALGKMDIVGMFREVTKQEGNEDRSPNEIEMELRAKLALLFDPAKSNGARH